MSMDVDENTPVAEMVNGHKGDGEYTVQDLFSGPAVDSPEPTNEPTPPPTLNPAPPTPTMAQPPTTSPPDPFAPALPTSNPPTGADADVAMKDAPSHFTTTKPFHEPPTTDEPPAKRLKTEPSPPTYDTTKRIPQSQLKFLLALLRQVKKSKDAGPFSVPVDPVRLNIPKYFDIVSRPMDISTIEKKLNSGQYPVVQALVDDFILMIDNCVKFNGPDNPVTKMGKNIQATFEKGMKTLPPEQVCRPVSLVNSRYLMRNLLLPLRFRSRLP
jgi:bromodomain-containing factor 1